MNRSLKKYFFIALLVSVGLRANNNCRVGVSPYFSPRSQSEDSARELVGWANQVNLYDMQKIYGSFAVTPEYTQSFRDNRILCCLFGNSLQCVCDCPYIQISGSAVENRCPCDWLADYFGLPPDFQSRICFEPKVQNFLVDFNLYLGLDEWLDGLYFRIHAPVVHTRWRLDFCETICESGTQGYIEGYFTQDEAGIPRQNLLCRATDFFSNCATPNLGTGSDAPVFRALSCCKWADCNCDPLTETRLSDIQVAFGWNFFQDEDYHFGLNIRFAAPTGTRPDGSFLFEPVVGNGHHWELGGGYTTHVILWRSEDEDRHFGFYSDGNFTHMFSTRQCRCFDLCCPCENSRYMLAARLGTPVEKNLQGQDINGNFTASIAQFKNEYAPVANLTFQAVDVSIGVQADITAMFNYTGGGFNWDIGYNFWGRSCEKICPRCDCPTPLQDGKTWVLKGDSHMFGFDGANAADFVPLAPSQNGTSANCCANIHTGRNATDTTVTVAPGVTATYRSRQNPGIDNGQDAIGDSSGGAANNQLLTGRNNLDTIRTSIQPVFLSNCDVDFCAARTKGISHKLFTHFSYVWIDHEDWIPYVGIGAKVEFGGEDCCDCCCDTSCCPTTSTACNQCVPCCDPCGTNCCDPCCDPCRGCCKTTLSEWGVWLKGGVSFR